MKQLTNVNQLAISQWLLFWLFQGRTLFYSTDIYQCRFDKRYSAETKGRYFRLYNQLYRSWVSSDKTRTERCIDENLTLETVRNRVGYLIKEIVNDKRN